MAKKFYFDDEFEDDDLDFNEADFSNQKITNQSENKKEFKIKKPKLNNSSATKEKKKLPKKLYIFLTVCAALLVAVIIYCVVVSMQKGPVYGKRCKGLVTEITESDISKAKESITSEYSDEIDSIDYEIACKQVKIDIVFTSHVDAQDAENIGEEAAIALDDAVGLDKQKNSRFSKLFGVDDDENQYEVNLYMINKDNDDFPIYGTKTAQSEDFGYTLASVKDEESRQKALDTVETEEE